MRRHGPRVFSGPQPVDERRFSPAGGFVHPCADDVRAVNGVAERAPAVLVRRADDHDVPRQSDGDLRQAALCEDQPVDAKSVTLFVIVQGEGASVDEQRIASINRRPADLTVLDYEPDRVVHGGEWTVQKLLFGPYEEAGVECGERIPEPLALGQQSGPRIERS
jgi:hypothetical protein